MLTVEQSREFEFIQGLSAELSSKELIFPTSINITMKIRHALGNLAISNNDVARIISAEPVLSAQVLRLSNSALMNPGGKKIVDLRTATLLLGFSTVRNVAISVGMRQLMERQSSPQISALMEGLWCRSLRVASLSYAIAKHNKRLNPDKALLAGLLHDVGKFYILNRAGYYHDLFVSEAAVWNMVDQWHASIGAAILDNWGIDDEIQLAVKDHLSHDIALASKASLTDVVATADFLDAHSADQSIAELNWKTVPASLHNLHLDQEQTLFLLSETKRELNLILQAIG